MFLLIVAAVLLIVAIAAFSTWKRYAKQPREKDFDGSNGLLYGSAARSRAMSAKMMAGSIAIAALILAVCLAVLSCITTVPPKNVGVATSFGKPVTAYDNGFHFKAPWYKVTDLDGTRQTDTFGGESCITVRLADQSEACVNASVQWEIRRDGAEELYATYRGSNSDITQAISDNVVQVQLRAALNRAFGEFDPLNSISSDGEVDKSALNVVSENAQTQLLAELKKIGGGREQIELFGVTVPNITYDERTQSRINGLRDEMAKTRVAQQQQETNKELARANNEIANSLKDNPEVLTDLCLRIWAEKGENAIPVQCFGGEPGVLKTTK